MSSLVSGRPIFLPISITIVINYHYITLRPCSAGHLFALVLFDFSFVSRAKDKIIRKENTLSTDK